MRITNTNQITFSEPNSTGRGREYYQSIIFNRKEIGALISRETSLLTQIMERYQMCAPELDAPKFDGFEESEDEGFVLGYFKTLEKFIEYYNSKL
jgi:hypothetical protein